MAERATALFAGRRGMRLELVGHVQGVGFRPFVYRLATELGICGEVANSLGTVQILAEGSPEALRDFQRRLIDEAPPLAAPSIRTTASVGKVSCADFQIRDSSCDAQARIFVPPDYYLCGDCRREMADPADRRCDYPFINCTQCGPRYTLIHNLPYDRANTSMAAFPLCRECLAEYSDPADRRFHAEPVACPDCGPHLLFQRAGHDASSRRQAALADALDELRQGNILAVKGIGGYHLMCDATDPRAVANLRQRKQRPDKPLAVMFPLGERDDLECLRRSVTLTAEEADLVLSPARPIVLAHKREDDGLAPNLAPSLSELGVFLPYSPLHQLLLSSFGGPLVATSGNLSGEPVLTDNDEATSRLGTIADAFLHHDRPIVRPADDPVFRIIAGRTRALRIGRGVAPLELEMPSSQAEPVICVGGHMKATVTLSFEDRAVVSPHIGEMDSPRSMRVFEQVLTDLQDLYGVRATRIVCDAHPAYANTRWAYRQQSLPVTPVWHHRAHAAALAGECGLPGPWLVFTWDGVGLGEDGSLWGGEALLGEPGNWRRVCSLRPFRPPGGERAGREPWRSAAALAWACGTEWGTGKAGLSLARHAWARGINCPQTSAAGRLFDAAAACIANTQEVSFEAQGPMILEALCTAPGTAIPLPMEVDEDDVLRSDWRPLVGLMTDTRRQPAARAEDFHSSMARLILDQACAVRERHDVRQVGFAGGVFQNRVLTVQARQLLQSAAFDVRLNRTLPCNDAALSFGQAVEAAASQRKDDS